MRSDDPFVSFMFAGSVGTCPIQSHELRRKLINATPRKVILDVHVVQKGTLAEGVSIRDHSGSMSMFD